jgi:hypothetical protein
MTSVSGYKIYMANCCATEVRVPIYASINSSTAFNAPECNCRKVMSIDDMDLLHYETPKVALLSEGGVDNYEIPKFLKIERNLHS